MKIFYRDRLGRVSLSLFSLILIVYVVFPKTVLATNREEVLGVQTDSSTVNMSPTTEGPGLILPDSPFFALDELKQSLRLAFAITPEAKMRVHSAIAGERLAELRYMLARDNKRGIEIALNGVGSNLEAAANALAESHFSGNDVSKLALNVNTDIKAKQRILDNLEAKATGTLKSQIALTQEKVLYAKLTVADSLSEDESQKELVDDLNRNVDRDINNIEGTVSRLEKNIDSLNSLNEGEVAGASTSALDKKRAIKELIKSKLEKRREAVKKIREALKSSRTQ